MGIRLNARAEMPPQQFPLAIPTYPVAYEEEDPLLSSLDRDLK
jgi:hypothetical protein